MTLYIISRQSHQGKRDNNKYTHFNLSGDFSMDKFIMKALYCNLCFTQPAIVCILESEKINQHWFGKWHLTEQKTSHNIKPGWPYISYIRIHTYIYIYNMSWKLSELMCSLVVLPKHDLDSIIYDLAINERSMLQSGGSTIDRHPHSNTLPVTLEVIYTLKCLLWGLKCVTCKPLALCPEMTSKFHLFLMLPNMY